MQQRDKLGRFLKGSAPWQKGRKSNVPRCPTCQKFLGKNKHLCNHWESELQNISEIVDKVRKIC